MSDSLDKLEKAIKDGETNNANRFEKLEQAITSLKIENKEQIQQLEKSIQTKLEQSAMNPKHKSKIELSPSMQEGLVRTVQARKTIKFSFDRNSIISNSYVLVSPVEAVANRDWSIYAFFDNSRRFDFSIYLRCNCEGGADFCDTSFTISFYGAQKVYSKEFTFRFRKIARGFDQHGFDGIMTWKQFSQLSNGATFTVEVDLKIYETIDANQSPEVVNKFCSATSFPSDCVLLIDGKRIHVSKGLLSVHSQFFNKLFNGGFSENHCNEIAVEDLDAAEFCQLLQTIYPSLQETVSPRNVGFIIKLADRFVMDAVLNRCEQFLLNLPASVSFSFAKKMLIAQEYGLKKLMGTCIAQYKSVESFRKLMKEPEYASLNLTTIRALLDSSLGDLDLQTRGVRFSHARC